LRARPKRGTLNGTTAARKRRPETLPGNAKRRPAMSMNRSDVEQFGRAVAKSLHDHWVAFLIEGIVLVILGAAAIIVPPLATLSVAIFLGWLFLVGGVIGLITTFRMRHAPGFWWSLFSDLLGIVAGVVLIGWPASGAISLTLVVIVFFAFEGVATIMYALDHKRELTGRWGWMLVSGLVDLFFAGIIFAGLPVSAAWAIGLLVGINMMFGGVALIMMALHARASAP
jgi:uncharacterized membrane protein HdeD (DUF308 family)